MNSHSHKTAISRRAFSAPVRWLILKGHVRPNVRVLDYGCGKGFDCDTMGWDGYDPHHRPFGANGWYPVVVSVYVANVLTDGEVPHYLDGIRASLDPGGTAYIAVRRDVKVEGWTSKGTYQTNRKLDLPLLYERKGAFAIYTLTKEVTA